MKTEVKFTASVNNPDTEEEFHGYVDPQYSMWTLFEDEPERRFVFDTKAEAEEFVDSTIGSADHFDGEDWYAADAKMNLESGEDWSYHARFYEVAE